MQDIENTHDPEIGTRGQPRGLGRLDKFSSCSLGFQEFRVGGARDLGCARLGNRPA